jgi:hypothetical protein
MRSIALVATVLVVVIAATKTSSNADTSPALTGKMMQLQFLVGTWSCTTKIPAMAKTKAQTISAQNAYWIEPTNVIGSYYRSEPYSASSYMGWQDSKQVWWSSGADVYGSAFSSTGKDSGTNVQVMTGTNWSQGHASQSRDTITKLSDTSYTDHFELLQGGNVTFQATSTCTKVSNKPTSG